MVRDSNIPSRLLITLISLAGTERDISLSPIPAAALVGFALPSPQRAIIIVARAIVERNIQHMLYLKGYGLAYMRLGMYLFQSQ